MDYPLNNARRCGKLRATPSACTRWKRTRGREDDAQALAYIRAYKRYKRGVFRVVPRFEVRAGDTRERETERGLGLG